MIKNMAAGFPPAVEAGILPSGKNHSRGRNGWYCQGNGAMTLFPLGGTRRGAAHLTARCELGASL